MDLNVNGYRLNKRYQLLFDNLFAKKGILQDDLINLIELDFFKLTFSKVIIKINELD